MTGVQTCALPISTGAASIGLDQLAQIAGSDQPVDQKKAAILAGLGFVGEFAAPIADRFLSTILSRNRFFRAGKLTPQGREAIKNAGVNPEAVTPEFAKVFSEHAKRATSPGEAAALAESR